MDNRPLEDGLPEAEPSERQPSAEVPASSDGPPDEIEPGEALKEEVDRLVHHPRAETSRLREVEAKGESGATPYLYLTQALRIILPAAAVLLAIALLTYYFS